ncbi:MAG: DsbA family protein [Marinobacter sp.]|nr:DsbA family protein [Marinobacter sp.]
MSARKALMPYVARALSSPGLRRAKRGVHQARRRALGEPRRLSIFLKVDDPYSYLLIQVLREFLGRFDVVADFYTVRRLPDEMYPRPEMWRENAVYDARHLAGLYGLDFPPPSCNLDEALVEGATAALVAAESEDDYLTRAEEIFACLWAEQPSAPADAPDYQDAMVQARLVANESGLAREGHYLSATIHYGGEWYWGLDRLDHLERRLIEEGAAFAETDSVRFDRTYRDFCTTSTPPTAEPETPLVIYWSARSPYSYIGLERAVRLARQHQLPLEIRPVLPMMMRGMNVPTTKKMYIFLDTKREAEKLGMPYGFVADPLGPAVERCYALVEYARAHGKLEDFLLSFGRAVNAEGIRAESDSGLKRIVERAGLSWVEARPHLQDDSWREWAQHNLDEMFALGCWGVPSFRYGELRFWGQDRLGIIENAVIGQRRLRSTEAAGRNTAVAP